ncbi:hypothetical protein GQ600_4278 [Phytophthora cactorum]|nr:hypothetical protein GQ600_4278 [Phytophthora cactorum]
MVSLTAGVSKLQRLQRLSAEGKSDELRAAITQCTCKELRSFIGLLGVPVRGKDYAIYSNKTGYADLLFQILTRKNVTVTKTRRTKNCNLRLVNVVFGEVLATFVDAMNAEHAQTALTSDQPAGITPSGRKQESEKSYEGPSKTEQRARLMELIKDACETLKAVREAGLGKKWKKLFVVSWRDMRNS